MANIVRVIRCSGQEEVIYLDEGEDETAAIEKLISADCFDFVRLHNGYIMIVDDAGVQKERCFNPKATFLYHHVGGNPQWPILGDVAIVKEK